MCVQCMLTATTAGATATGLRSWLATRDWRWLTPVRLRRVTAVIMFAALCAVAGGAGHTASSTQVAHASPSQQGHAVTTAHVR